MIDRRTFVRGATAAGVVGLVVRQADAEPPPETTKVSFFQLPSVCTAPAAMAEGLLRAEGFTDVRYVPNKVPGTESSRKLAAGDADFSLNFAAPLVLSLEAGNAVVVLAGIHAGCLEIVTAEHVRTMRDLKGRTIGIDSRGSITHVFMAAMLAHVGVDPERDVQWALHPSARHAELLLEGRIDALVAVPPGAQALRARKVGRVVLATVEDRPWSQYFCCMLEGNREFVRRHPVATKRALRAVLKATTLCSVEPERVARQLVDRGQAASYEYTLQALRALPYGEWRTFDPEDSLRFYALRLHEAKMIRSKPQKLIAEGTDWRFINELKRELKG